MGPAVMGVEKGGNMITIGSMITRLLAFLCGIFLGIVAVGGSPRASTYVGLAVLTGFLAIVSFIIRHIRRRNQWTPVKGTENIIKPSLR